MTGRVRIRQISRGLFRDKITVEALDDCSMVWDSLLGPREFWLNAGDRCRVPIGKGLYFEGDTASFSRICTAGNAFSFPWQWTA